MTMAACSTRILTVDVEDWARLAARRVSGFRDPLPAPEEGACDAVRASLHTLLDLLGERRIAATFFVLGGLAAPLAPLLREMIEEGHEIACHSWSHTPLPLLGPKGFAEDLRRGREALEDATGVRVQGYRAPEFSLGPEQSWAFDVLASRGFRYDSSVFPGRHRRYGHPGFAGPTALVSTLAGNLWEVPVTPVRAGRRPVLAAGGGALRLLPRRWLRRTLCEAAVDSGHGMLYLHPHDFHAAPDASAPGGLRGRLFALHQGLGRRRVLPVLEDLLEEGRWTTIAGRLEELARTPRRGAA